MKVHVGLKFIVKGVDANFDAFEVHREIVEVDDAKRTLTLDTGRKITFECLELLMESRQIMFEGWLPESDAVAP